MSRRAARVALSGRRRFRGRFRCRGGRCRASAPASACRRVRRAHLLPQPLLTEAKKPPHPKTGRLDGGTERLDDGVVRNRRDLHGFSESLFGIRLFGQSLQQGVVRSATGTACARPQSSAMFPKLAAALECRATPFRIARQTQRFVFRRVICGMFYFTGLKP